MYAVTLTCEELGQLLVESGCVPLNPCTLGQQSLGHAGFMAQDVGQHAIQPPCSSGDLPYEWQPCRTTTKQQCQECCGSDSLHFVALTPTKQQTKQCPDRRYRSGYISWLAPPLILDQILDSCREAFDLRVWWWIQSGSAACAWALHIERNATDIEERIADSGCLFIFKVSFAFTCHPIMHALFCVW